MVKHCANCKYLNLKVKTKRYMDDYYKCQKKSTPKKTIYRQVINVCPEWELEDGTDLFIPPDPIEELMKEPPKPKPKKKKKKKTVSKSDPFLHIPRDKVFEPEPEPLPEPEPEPSIEEIFPEKPIELTPEEKKAIKMQELQAKLAALEAEE